MDQKPNMMNQEWLNHLAKIDGLLYRINKLEQRIEILENQEKFDSEENALDEPIGST